MSFSCYCLVDHRGRTYVGFSTNVDRRLRQHNGELVGGAKYTHGSHWTRLCTITGFPTQQSALQFEWKWKYLSRKATGVSAVERRCAALIQLLNEEKPTSSAQLFSTYENPLLVLAETDIMRANLKDKHLLYGVLVE
jgi:predicted GIY-YIG superfamily endonuclease